MEPSFIGKEIPPTPSQCTLWEGGMIGATDSFAFEVLFCESQQVLLLQKFIERRGKMAYFRVVDEVRMPIKSSEPQFLEIPLCSSKSHPGEAIAATGTWHNLADGSFIGTDITKAWWLNAKLQKLVSIPVGDVTCEGEAVD